MAEAYMVNFICRVVVGDRLEVNHDENNPNRLVVLERNSSAKLGSNKDLFTDGPGPNNLLVQHEAVTLHHLSARAFSATSIEIRPHQFYKGTFIDDDELTEEAWYEVRNGQHIRLGNPSATGENPATMLDFEIQVEDPVRDTNGAQCFNIKLITQNDRDGNILNNRAIHVPFRKIVLSKGATARIGTAPDLHATEPNDNNLVINNPALARYHAVIMAVNGESIKIKPLQLAKTTFIDKKRLRSDRDWETVRNGEVIRLGTPPERGQTCQRAAFELQVEPVTIEPVRAG